MVTHAFKRLLLSFKAMKSGFINGCKPFIRLDICHLKGPYRGISLDVVALDGINSLFSITSSVVKSENKHS